MHLEPERRRALKSYRTLSGERQICGSKRRDPLHDGQRPGFVSRSSLNTKPHALHRAGITSMRQPAATAERSACCKSSSTSPR